MTLIVFAITIAAVVVNKLDATVAALLGVVVMIWMGTMTEVEAAQLVDWNVMAILVGIWIIAGYFGKTGVPSWLSVQSLKLSGGRPGPADPRAVDADRPAVDVHRQRGLHPDDGAGGAAAGARARHSRDAARADDRLFRQLHGHRAAARRPAAADAAQRRRRRVLRLHLAARTAVVVPDPDGGVRRSRWRSCTSTASAASASRRRKASPASSPTSRTRLFAFIAVGMFLLTVFAMAMREFLGVKLGFIALTGAVILVLIVEIMGEKLKDAPSFEHIVQELDWRAVFFYIALFALVGGLEKTHILDMLANWMQPMFVAELRARRHHPLLGHDPDRRHRRARRLHPHLPEYDQGARRPGRSAVAAVVGRAVGGNARQQPHGRGRAGALRGAAHRREGGRPQGLAAGVPVLEHCRSAWSARSSAYVLAMLIWVLPYAK